MSSINDVENAMVNVIGPAMYPNGTSNPSITGNFIAVAPGDFIKSNVDTGLAAGQSFVAVLGINIMTRNTTRLRRAYCDEVINPAQLTLTLSGNTVTVSGAINIGEAAMIIVKGTGYATGVVLGSTFDTIAAALAAQIPNATVLNNVITINGTYDIIARVSTQGTARKILYSQEGLFRVEIISPNATDRNTIGSATEIAFGLNGYYLPMPDLISASIKRLGGDEVNRHELANAFVRNYTFLVEYHTVSVGTFQTITDPYVITTVSELPIPS